MGNRILGGLLDLIFPRGDLYPFNLLDDLEQFAILCLQSCIFTEHSAIFLIEP
jgi:hypothetical protein